MSFKKAAENSNLNLALNTVHLESGVTQSELATMDDCKLKWNYTYNNLLIKRGLWTWPFVIGSALHDFFEKFYKGECDPGMVSMEQPDEDVLKDEAFNEEYQYWLTVLGAVQRMYAKHYASDLTDFKCEIVEEVIVRQYRGITFTGKLDLAARRGEGSPLFIMDHKTTGNLAAITESGWNFRLQFQFYPWLLEELAPKKFVINAIKKPMLRLAKGETKIAFRNRVAKDIAARPEEYFKRESMPITPAMIRRFEKFVLDPKIDHILAASDNPALISNPNTNTCTKYGSTCQFMPICVNGWEAEQFQYTKRETKHVELKPAE